MDQASNHRERPPPMGIFACRERRHHAGRVLRFDAGGLAPAVLALTGFGEVCLGRSSEDSDGCSAFRSWSLPSSTSNSSPIIWPTICLVRPCAFSLNVLMTGLLWQRSWGTRNVSVESLFRSDWNRNGALSFCFDAFSSREPVSTSLENVRIRGTFARHRRLTGMAIPEEMNRCIETCLSSYRICLSTAMNHCLETGGKHVEPAHFRLMMACAEICRTSAHFMLINTPHHKHTCKECAEICTECAADCERVGGMQACVAMCRACAESCRKMAA